MDCNKNLPSKTGTYPVKIVRQGKEEISTRFGRVTLKGFQWLVRYGVEVTHWDRHCKSCMNYFNGFCYQHNTCTQEEDECDL